MILIQATQAKIAENASETHVIHTLGHSIGALDKISNCIRELPQENRSPDMIHFRLVLSRYSLARSTILPLLIT
jgi:hypothetical protein